MHSDLTLRFESLKDEAFRNRALIEYRTISKWVSHYLDLDSTHLRVLDFGCGQGVAAASFALHKPAATIFGIDVNTVDIKHLEIRLQRLLGVTYPVNLTLNSTPPCHIPSEMGNLDLVYAWSVFEHIRFDQLQSTLTQIRSHLNPNGLFFLQISPLFFSPRGSHLYSILSEPWAHLLLEHDVLHEEVMRAQKSELSKINLLKQFVELNRATADDILEQCKLAGFTKLREHIKRIDIEPPERLLRAYSRDALITEQMVVLFRA